MSENFDDPAVPRIFAQLVGVTEQNIHLLRRQSKIPVSGSYRDVIFAYCEHLRKGHGQSVKYIRARTADLEASATLKQIKIAREVDAVTAEYQRIMDTWATQTRTQILAAGRQIGHMLETRGIAVDDEDILNFLRDALALASAVPEELALADAEGQQEISDFPPDLDADMDGTLPDPS